MIRSSLISQFYNKITMDRTQQIRIEGAMYRVCGREELMFAVSGWENMCICPAYILKINLKCEKQIILLMIPNKEKEACTLL